MNLSDWKKFANRIIARLWTYLGSLSAMALMIGVLGMGIYYFFHEAALGARSEYYAGFYNDADADAPVGIAPVLSVGDSPASQVRFDYDATGRLQRIVHLNGEGYPSLIPGSKVAEQRLIYDDAGRLVAKENVDIYGMAAPDSSGVAKRKFEYDEQGRLLSRSFYNAAGKGVVPLMPGFAVERRTYDENGRPEVIKYLDAAGKEIVNARGDATLRISYIDDGNCVFIQNEVDGKIRNNNAGYAIERRLSCNDGETQRTEWLNQDGCLVMNRDCGAAAVQCNQANDNVTHQSTQYLNEKGQSLQPSRVICEHLARFNGDGQLEWECFNAADGLPCQNDILGYAERVCEYGPDKHLECEYFWDERGQGVPCYQKKYTPEGEGVQVTSLFLDGSTATEFVAH